MHTHIKEDGSKVRKNLINIKLTRNRKMQKGKKTLKKIEKIKRSQERNSETNK